MELDEAITHALGIAEENENEARFYVHPQYPGVKETMDKCLRCAAEHRQLAEWLRELKDYRERFRWIPIETRESDDEERESLINIYDEYAAADSRIFSNPMPEEGQEILISTKYGVCMDVCTVDYVENLFLYGLEERGDWEGVDAWMPLPDPFRVDSEVNDG